MSAAKILAPRAAAGRKPAQVPSWTAKFWHDDSPGGAGYPGLATGRKRGLTNADMNVNACKRDLLHPNGVLINTHWPTTGRDRFTSSKVRGNHRFANLTWRQVKRLRTPAGDRIRKNRQIIRRAHRLGYTHLELELKDGVDHLTHKQLTALIRRDQQLADRLGINVYWKTLSNIGNPLFRVRAVHAAGGVAVLLPRDNPRLHRDVWWPVLDYVREGPGGNKVTWL